MESMGTRQGRNNKNTTLLWEAKHFHCNIIVDFETDENIVWCSCPLFLACFHNRVVFMCFHPCLVPVLFTGSFIHVINVYGKPIFLPISYWPVVILKCTDICKGREEL